jgi:glycosyltransferase involved in cell wall biosynthesis
MLTLRILYDVDGWAFHRRAVALQRHAPAGVAVSLAALPGVEWLDAALGASPPDVLFVMPGRKTAAARAALAQRAWATRLVASWNIGWPMWRDDFAIAAAAADAVIFNNRQYWDGTGRLPHTCVIANGVDLDTFRVEVPPASRTPRVLWLGSQLHRELKGYDDFILPLQRRLERDGIACDFRLVDSRGGALRSAGEMAAWYNGGTVLVCASAAEGTPNVALEAAACGCTVVSTPVGNMPELLRDGRNGYLVDRDVSALHAAVRRACDEYPRLAAAMRETIGAWDWRVSAAQHYALFRAVTSAPPRG